MVAEIAKIFERAQFSETSLRQRAVFVNWKVVSGVSQLLEGLRQSECAVFACACGVIEIEHFGNENSPRFILVEAGDYRLDAARFAIDVDEFDSALAKARVAADDEAAVHFLEQAVNLYKGEYLQNLYYDWLFPERRRLAQAYLGALRALADHHYIHKRYTRSLELLERALRMDNLQEDLHYQTLRVHAALGDRAGLVSQYQEMKRVFAKELDMEPLQSTTALYQSLMERFAK